MRRGEPTQALLGETLVMGSGKIMNRVTGGLAPISRGHLRLLGLALLSNISHSQRCAVQSAALCKAQRQAGSSWL